MVTTKLIKQIFGNHEMVARYIKFIRNPRHELPPFPLVLYRQIAFGENEFDIIELNKISQHKAQIRHVMNQLILQYNFYSELLNA